MRNTCRHLSTMFTIKLNEGKSCSIEEKRALQDFTYQRNAGSEVLKRVDANVFGINQIQKQIYKRNNLIHYL